MKADDYQRLAGRTLIDRPDFAISDADVMVVWNAIGLAGEAGEFCELVKKGVFHRKGIDREQAKKELGDVCWYLAALCTKLDLSLAEVMQANVEKLKLRYPDGWDQTRSHAAGAVPADEAKAP
jgi:NTP pyrophosphatase (non-canonical NTP hydrolase)